MELRGFVASFASLIFSLALFLPLPLAAAEINFQSDTILRLLERDTTTDDSAAVVPLYEYLQADVGGSGEDGLSFHLYGWGRWDMADNNYFEDSVESELLYGYLEYNGEQANFRTRLGRQYIFSGVANETVDGLSVRSDLGKYFSGSVYAGLPVAYADSNGRDGDSVFGGRIANHLPGWYDLGLSYQKVRSDSQDAEEKAGLDLSAYLPYAVNLYGFSAYNLDSEEFSEHSYELRFAAGPVQLRPYFQYFQYDDYFANSAEGVNPFPALATSGEELSVLGAEATLPALGSWTLIANLKQYNYDVLDDTALYYSGRAIWTSDKDNLLGGEVGIMDGDESRNQYVLFRVFGDWRQLPEMLPFTSLSSELVYVDYDQPIYGEDSSLFISVGVSRMFLNDALECRLSGDFSQDPYYDEDLRGMLSLNYRFGTNL